MGLKIQTINDKMSIIKHTLLKSFFLYLLYETFVDKFQALTLELL